MVAAFDFTSWYATLIYVVGGLLVLVAAGEKLWGWTGWLRDRGREPDRPVASEEPYVVLGHPGGEQSMTPLHELADDEPRRLTRVAPRYLIENKDTVGIRDVTSGVRTRDGREHRFDEFFAGLIGAGETAEVAIAGSVPPDVFDGIHESEAFTAFLYWARFRRGGVRWEVLYDPRTRRNTYRELPQVEPKLDVRVHKTARNSEVIEVTNSGDSPVEKVEIDFPPEAQNWHLLTDAIATYPIRVLEPGDSQSIPLAVTMGGPASVDVVVRGHVDGEPYERTRSVSVIG